MGRKRLAMQLSRWITAARPRTLSLSVAPVIVGTALAWAMERRANWPAVGAAIVASAFIQIGTNLHNDAADYKRGGDGPDRIGPPRATASGLLDGTMVNRAACGCFAVAAVMGIYLIWVGGWPIFLLGLASILSGWAYTGGPLPIAYTPIGELFVIAFFGVGAVCGTYWLNVHKLSASALVASLAVGCLTGAVLLVNNTLAQMLPTGHVWPALTVLPLAGLLIYRFAHETAGREFNRILVQTVVLQSLFCFLLSLGLVS